MHPKQMKHLMRRPQAMMRHQMTGQLPRMITPRSPLIDLLERMGPRERLRFRGVRLHPDLGYHCGLQFHNGEQLLRWLKPDAVVFPAVPEDTQRPGYADPSFFIPTIMRSVCPVGPSGERPGRPGYRPVRRGAPTHICLILMPTP